MAVRNTTLKLSGSDLQVMSASDITNIQQQAIHQYALNPSVTLSLVSQDGSLNRMIDRRYQAGTASSTNTAFPANSPNIQAIDTVWDTIDQAVGTPANTWQQSNVNRAYPVFLNSDDEIQAMSREDFYDTFIDPAIAAWYAPTGSGNFAGAGQYAIYASNSESGFTLVGSDPVFTDSISADTIRSGNLPENPLDQPSTGTSYYLHVKNSSAVSYSLPFQIDSDGNIQQFTAADFNSLLQYHMRYAIVSRSGSQIRYQIEDQDGTQGRTSGTGIADTQYDSFSRRNQQIDDTYYTQEVPAGNIETRKTYYLKIVNSGNVSGTDTSESYSASATPSGEVDEGLVLTFTLTTNNVPNGTSVPYAISGITNADISAGSLSGNVTIQGNTGSTQVTLVKDFVAENETATCNFTTNSGTRTVSVDIGDVPETVSLEGSSTNPEEPNDIPITDGEVSVGWRFYSNGTVAYYNGEENPTDDTTGHANWINNPSPVNDYWIRASSVNFSGIPTGLSGGSAPGTLGTGSATWYKLTGNGGSNRLWAWIDYRDNGSYGNVRSDFKVEIATDANGNNIVATGYYRVRWEGGA